MANMTVSLDAPERTVKSPQILELSGIGRRDVLEKLNIPVKVDLPGVGENVQEHAMVRISWGELATVTYIVSASRY